MSHCGRDPSVIGYCGGTDETCSCECNTCLCPVCGLRECVCPPYQESSNPAMCPHTRREERILRGGDGPDDAATALTCSNCGALGWRYCDDSVKWSRTMVGEKKWNKKSRKKTKVSKWKRGDRVIASHRLTTGGVLGTLVPVHSGEAGTILEVSADRIKEDWGNINGGPSHVG